MIFVFISISSACQRIAYEVVFNNEGGPLRAHDKLLDNLTREDTLFRIEVGGRFVDQENVRGNTQYQANCNTL